MGTRRDFIKKASYAAPVVVTMAAKPAFASTGSCRTTESQYPQSDQQHYHKRRRRYDGSGTGW